MVKKNCEKNSIFFALIIALCLILTAGSCSLSNSSSDASPKLCHIVIEDSDAFTAKEQVFSVPFSANLEITLSANTGYRITGCDYPEYELAQIGSSSEYLLTLNSVCYSSVVVISSIFSDLKISYIMDLPSESTIWEYYEYPLDTHLQINTARFMDEFDVDGYTLTGWNTQKDGSGDDIGLGSRVALNALDNNTLYARWEKWCDASLLQWEENASGITITGCSATGNKTLIIPARIQGLPVTKIASNAFENNSAGLVVLPYTLRDLEKDAFRGSSISELTIYDSIENISDYSFSGCTGLKTLHINAVKNPVYSGTYFATFPDKVDYLRSLYRDYPSSRKLVLFSGSSTRFGYDSPMIEEAFTDTLLKVANMGVFAYTNALPQLDIILQIMQPGDVLLDSPEFDASKRQFCTTNKLDDKFFNMVEENYDLVEMLDLRDYSEVFSAFNTFLKNRHGITAKSYDLSPSSFDEDQNPVETPSYNPQGDYILFRPDSENSDPVFGLEVDYTVSAFPAEYISSLNAVIQRFKSKGISFCYTYSPRNEKAISKDSTLENRKELDKYLRENLQCPVISELEDSLYPGNYLYGTDNHLSSNGVKIRTAGIIKDLKPIISP